MKNEEYKTLGIDVHINEDFNCIWVDNRCMKFGEVITHNKQYPFKKDDPNYGYLSELFAWAYFCEIVISNRPKHPKKYMRINNTSSDFELRKEYSEQEVDEIYNIILTDIDYKKYEVSILFKGVEYHFNKNSLISIYRLIQSDVFYSYIFNELIKYYNIDLQWYFPDLSKQAFIKSSYKIHENSVTNPYILKLCNGSTVLSNIGYARYIYANAIPSNKENIINIKDLKITEDEMIKYFGLEDIKQSISDYSKDKLSTKNGLIEIVESIRHKMDTVDPYNRRSRMGAILYNPFNKTVSFKIYKY